MTGSRKRERPPVDPAGGPSANLSVWVAATDYDRPYTRAQHARVSLMEYVRQTLRTAIRQDPPKP